MLLYLTEDINHLSLRQTLEAEVIRQAGAVTRIQKLLAGFEIWGIQRTVESCWHVCICGLG